MAVPDWNQSHLPLFAIASIKIQGVDHEFSTVKGVVEDVTEIILNLKQVRLKRQIENTDYEKVTLSINGQEQFKAGDISNFTTAFQVLNPDLVVCNMDPKVKLQITITIGKGRGYRPAEENKSTSSPVGTIAIDSIFTPIRNVKFGVENFRVEQKTDYEKLVFEIQGDGSISPKNALQEAAKILIHHFMLFSDERITLEQESKRESEEFDESSMHMRQLLKTKLVDMDLSVRALDEIIDYQNYPVKAAENFTKRRRSLGIGYIGLAHFLAKHGVKYEDPASWNLVHDLSEAFQYYLIKSTVNLAKEKGACEYSHRTKYGQGILPIDTYKRDVDEIVPNNLKYDWDSLREQVKQYGVRNSTLSAQMPSESSSVVSNATNGIEPPRGYLSIKKSKKGPLKQIVPQYQTLKNNYTLLWDMPSNTGYINIVAVMQKFFDQAISGNWSYNPENYPNNEVPVSVMAQDLLTTYKLGWKTSYYQNTYDIKTDEVVEESKEDLQSLLNDIMSSDENDCESCKI